jgi:hypothetical protein
MNEFGNRLIDEARTQIGAPFRSHFKPENICLDGIITPDSCMEHGMDALGYDCSGLVVASMCRVLDIHPQDWPRNLRHAVQLQRYSVIKDFEPGDIQFYYYDGGGIHSGIATASPDVCVYASGKTQQVQEGFAADGASPIAQRSLAALQLRDIVLAELALRPNDDYI